MIVDAKAFNICGCCRYPDDVTHRIRISPFCGAHGTTSNNTSLGGGLLTHASYHSAMMNEDIGYTIYLPTQYTANVTVRFTATAVTKIVVAILLIWMAGLPQARLNQ